MLKVATCNKFVNGFVSCTVMLAVLPLILGFQLILQAIVLDIQETPK